MCRAEPGLSGRGGGAAEARLTVNGEKAAPSRGRGSSWDAERAEWVGLTGWAWPLEEELCGGGAWLGAGPGE